MTPTRRLAAAAALLVLGAAACIFGIDPDAPRFRCEEEKDCGQGFECRPQAAGGGLCYRAGECTGEVCNEQDDNCDGQVDEGFDLSSDPAHCGSCGVACGAGSFCAQGHCRESTCDDGQDNDQDGPPDCADDDCPLGGGCAGDGGLNCGRLPPDAGELDGGALDAGEVDGGAPDAGAPERACVPRESQCDDGVDNDLDGKADCEDPDCEGQVCGAAGRVCAGGACAR